MLQMLNRYLIGIKLRLGLVTVALHASWLIVLPLALWAINSIYVPILGSYMDTKQTWAVAALILFFGCLSLAAHLLAHLYTASALHSSSPDVLALILFGDAAQSWPAAGSAWQEALGALAGPLANLLLAVLAYLVWNTQITPIVSLSMLFLCGFNLWLAIINLIPAFPFDGGRLLRAILWDVLKRPAAAARLGMRLGYGIVLAIAGWGIFLIAQRAQVSLQTGVITLAFSLLALAGLTAQPAWEWDKPLEAESHASHPALRILLAGLLLLLLLAIPSSLLLTNDGLEAPGLALSVEPMVEVPASHHFTHSGSLILTSVLSQTPITAGEWLVGQLTPVVKIVPPAEVVPKGSTPQEVARQGFSMLDESETAAIVVGLQQAGYDASLTGKGVRVLSLLPESLAQNLLQPGDVITGLGGKPIRTTGELTQKIKAQDPQQPVELQITRGQESLDVSVPLIPPASPGEPPRLGILIESAGFDAHLPFPVKINPVKIVGGPSAGLMFALTVYNAVTPEDLTGGRKIAGTGTINPDGSVGPIGGVQQKVAAAELAGASYFLSPVENYADALSAARHIQVVEVSNIRQAIDFLRSLPAN